jgi:hypothetical protein
MFHHRSKGKGKKGESSSSSQACSGTSTELFVVIVLLNFYLHMSSFIITLLLPIWYILSFFLFVGHFILLTPTGGLSRGFARRGLLGDAQSMAGVAWGSRGAQGQSGWVGGSRGAWGAGGWSGRAGGPRGVEHQGWGWWPATGHLQVRSILIHF